MPYPDTPWRERLRPASFRGAAFHVEVGAPAGGRRVVPYEFPQNDTPYTGDMGRRIRRFGVTAYILGRNYLAARDALVAACEREGPGTLVHPTFGEWLVLCDTFNPVERREQGGYVEFDLAFVEAGTQSLVTTVPNTGDQVDAAADNAEAAVSSSYKTATTTTPAGVHIVGGTQQMDA